MLTLPAGIGIAPPQRRRGAYVLGGSCSYPLRTFEPTGVVVVDTGPPRSLRELFALWGQRLARGRLAGLKGRVLAFLDGRHWRGDPGSIPLRRHAQVVLEVGGFVAPHRTYTFAPML